jgi:hypothetical protein
MQTACHLDAQILYHALVCLDALFLINLISFIWALNYVKHTIGRFCSKLKWPIDFQYELFSNCSNPDSFSYRNYGDVDIKRHMISCCVHLRFFCQHVLKLLE